MYPLYLPYRQSTRWGFCTPDKKIVIPWRYDSVKLFSGDTAIVEEEGKYGAINRQGKLYIPFIYTSLRQAEQEIYMYEGEGLEDDRDLVYGEGCSEAPPPEDGTILNHSGVALVYSKGKYKTLDPTISPHSYESVSYHFYDGQKGGPIWVMLHGKWGVISPMGEQIIPCIYDDPEPVDEDYPEYSWVWLNGQLGIINYDNVQYWKE